MVGREPDEVEFRVDDREGVVERIRTIAADRSGWVNFVPGVPDDVPVPRQGLLRFFGARGPEALMATWVPGEVKRDVAEPTTVGIQHAAGHRVRADLAAAGLPVPDGWRVLQDHSWRGLVVVVPDGADPDEVVGWLLAATEEVATFPLTGRWTAVFYSRS